MEDIAAEDMQDEDMQDVGDAGEVVRLLCLYMTCVLLCNRLAQKVMGLDLGATHVVGTAEYAAVDSNGQAVHGAWVVPYLLLLLLLCRWFVLAIAHEHTGATDRMRAGVPGKSDAGEADGGSDGLQAAALSK